MTVSHRDWKLSSSRICLAKIDIESDLDHYHPDRHQDRLHFTVEKFQTKMQNY